MPQKGRIRATCRKLPDRAASFLRKVLFVVDAFLDGTFVMIATGSRMKTENEISQTTIICDSLS